MKKTINILPILAILVTLCGCSTFLPSSKDVVRVPWNNFQEVKTAYNKVVPNETTTRQLRRLGFDLYSTPNITILNYLDVAGQTQNIRHEDLSPGLLKCIKAREGCQGYQFEPKTMKSERLGNFWLDLFNFRRKSRGTGWRFKALFLVVDDVVVDKFWNGDPKIVEEHDTKNPLGPFQDSGGVLLRLIP